jgi:hypothetical protein
VQLFAAQPSDLPKTCEANVRQIKFFERAQRSTFNLRSNKVAQQAVLRTSPLTLRSNTLDRCARLGAQRRVTFDRKRRVRRKIKI